MIEEGQWDGISRLTDFLSFLMHGHEFVGW